MRDTPDIDLGALFPLSLFYQQAQTPVPVFDVIDGDAMPDPYRKLLVHEDDMTPTLEMHHGRRIVLNLIMVQHADDAIMREVALVTEDERTPVEFGAIRIALTPFEQDARELILGCRTPLGTILDDFNIDHVCRPSVYFRVRSDDVINLALDLNEPCELYGRRNTLLTPDGRTLADVVEVLAP